MGSFQVSGIWPVSFSRVYVLEPVQRWSCKIVTVAVRSIADHVKPHAVLRHRHVSCFAVPATSNLIIWDFCPLKDGHAFKDGHAIRKRLLYDARLMILWNVCPVRTWSQSFKWWGFRLRVGCPRRTSMSQTVILDAHNFIPDEQPRWTLIPHGR